MKESYIIIALASLLFLAVGRTQADEPPALGAADAAFLVMDYPTAVAGYEALLRAAPDDAQILWRLARAYICIAEGEDDETPPRRMCEAAREFALRCVRVDSTLAEGHTWLAASLGYIALYESVRRQAEITNEILEETELALRLNPRDDAALSIRGSLFRALGNVGWVKKQVASLLFGGVPPGGFEEAEEALREAVAIAPDVMRHSYELGVLYLDWGKEDDARRALEQAKIMPVRVAIDRPRREKITLLLARLASGQ